MADGLKCTCRNHFDRGFDLDVDFTLDLDRAPITVLFGPSGAGKTTVLRMIAGLERPREGAIVFRGETWFDSERAICLSPQQRRAGYVAQSFDLFPHLTVSENIGYAARAGRAERYLEEFELAHLAPAYPRQISSGQRQRVALARALAAEPALLLLDEPLSSLHTSARVQIRRQLSQILVASGIPSIIVTHDRAEAAAFGDWIVKMLDGRLIGFGSAEAIRLGDLQAEFENVLRARVVDRGHGVLLLETGGKQLQAVNSGESGEVLASIHAADIAITRDTVQSSSIRNRLPCRVASVRFEGPLARVKLDCGFQLEAVITAQSAQELKLQSGDTVCAVIKATAIHVAPVREKRE